ncbi:hypothetical protein [Sulfurimonas sp. HSL3-7]|uniref:hypothetical protein n=1 Tax=Sulfonitrofixus jiaomeiensis TaxID=3131938 RepID=UPI0031F86FE5
MHRSSPLDVPMYAFGFTSAQSAPNLKLFQSSGCVKMSFATIHHSPFTIHHSAKSSVLQ